MSFISRVAVALLLTSGIVWGDPQEINFPIDFQKLAARASETVNVKLDSSMLKMASGFLDDGDKDSVELKELVSKLKGVYVHSFEFDKEGQYSTVDIENIRAQLKSPEWSRIVDVKSRDGETSDIFLKRVGEKIEGLVVIAAEPKELTLVHIDGPINPKDISKLSGHMGIPEIDRSAPSKTPEAKKKPED